MTYTYLYVYTSKGTPYIYTPYVLAVAYFALQVPLLAGWYKLCKSAPIFRLFDQKYVNMYGVLYAMYVYTPYQITYSRGVQ